MPGTVIVGAGFAGLAAAKSLLSSGDRDFVVLEARDRVGGRTKPGQLGDLTIDLGGMWMGSSQRRLKRLAASYKIRTYPTYLSGDAIFRVRGVERHAKGEDFKSVLGLFGSLDYLKTRWALERLMAPLNCARPWDHPEADWLDSTNVEQWIERRVWHPRLRAAFRTMCSTIFCAETYQVSLLFFLHYLKSGSGLDVLISSDSGGAQNLAFHGGVHQISRIMAARLGNRVHLNAPVHAIEWRDGQVTVRSAAGTWTARKAIITVPPKPLLRIRFSPALPKLKSKLHENLEMGSSIKFWVLYDSPFWRSRGLNGTILRDDTPATPIMDVSPPGQDRGVLVGFFDGDNAVQYAEASTEDRRQVVLDTLEEHFGPQARAPIAYVDNDWTGEEWSGGCYGAFAPPGVLARYGKALRKPIGPLHWAGTETSPVWTGYIEGAIRSGERAAREVSAGLIRSDRAQTSTR